MTKPIFDVRWQATLTQDRVRGQIDSWATSSLYRFVVFSRIDRIVKQRCGSVREVLREVLR